jgi:hypothetical protein
VGFAEGSTELKSLEDELEGDDVDEDESASESKEEPPQAEAVTEAPAAESKDEEAADDQASDEDTAVPGTEKKTIKQGGKRYVSHDHYKKKMGQMHSHVHHVFAKGVIVMIVVMSLIIALGSSGNRMIEKHTWSTMNMVVVVFLALSWFYVTMHLLEFHGLTGWTKAFMHMCIAVFLLLFSSLVSWIMNKRGGPKGVATFNAVFDYILLWCFAGFVSNVQQQFKYSAILVFLSIIGLTFFYAALALVWYFVVGKCTTRGWSDGTVNTLTGAALAAGTVLWVHMVIAGGYHTVEDPRPTKPSFFESVFMNCFSFVWIVVAIAFTPRVARASEEAERSKAYWKKRVIDSLAVFVSFLPYYSCVLSFGHLILDNCGYDVGAVEARLYLAALSTFIGMGLIVFCAKVKRIARDEHLSGMLVGLGGFMTGSAWANILNNSINMMAEGYEHPFKAKFICISLLTAIVFPVYFYYFKPVVDEKMKDKASDLQ